MSSLNRARSALSVREKAAWAAVAALSIATAAGWGGWYWEAAGRHQDRAEAEETIRYLGTKAARGLFLETQRAHDQATRSTDRQ
jgi:hypothetical protein